MDILDVSFSDSDSVYNIVTKSVLSEQAEHDILYHKGIGTGMYTRFYEDRITGNDSIWNTMKKRKLLTFKTLAKATITKNEGKIVELKEGKP